MWQKLCTRYLAVGDMYVVGGRRRREAVNTWCRKLGPFSAFRSVCVTKAGTKELDGISLFSPM